MGAILADTDAVVFGMTRTARKLWASSEYAGKIILARQIPSNSIEIYDRDLSVVKNEFCHLSIKALASSIYAESATCE